MNHIGITRLPHGGRRNFAPRRLRLESLEHRRLLATTIHMSGVGSSERDFSRPGQVLVGPADVSIDDDSIGMISIATVLESRLLPNGTIFGRVTHTFEFADGSTLTTLDHSRLVPTDTPGVSQFRPSRVVTDGTGRFQGARGRLGTIPGESNLISLYRQSATWSLRGTLVVPEGGPAEDPGLDIVAFPGAELQVTSTLDSGPGSLRQAILDANASVNTLDTIRFHVSGQGAHTIRPLSPLPPITDPVVIDGTSQPGYVDAPLIVLEGTQAGDDANGLLVTAGQSTVRGLVIGGFDENGILLASHGANVIERSYIGTDATGEATLPNGRNGIFIDGSPNNLIGGVALHAGNVISGNLGAGIEIVGPLAAGNRVEGNLIGIGRGGASDLGNAFDGVVIADAPGNTIGGTNPNARNVISGNDASGIAIIGAGSTGNQVQSNFLGTDSKGTAAVANALDGVTVIDAPGNVIGGTRFGDFGENLARNVISGNGAYGVTILGQGASGNRVAGNYIGADDRGLRDLGNGFDGILIDRAPANLIGGTETGPFGQNVARNLISGNDVFGVTILGETATSNVLEGNYIGTDVSGAQPLGNGLDGVVINSAPGNIIGGTTTGGFGTNQSRNVIAGNGNDGVSIVDSRAARNVVEGNYIGTDALANRDLGNGRNGIFITDAPANRIGGTSFDAANVISGNDGVGIHIVGGSASGNMIVGNSIGTDAFGTSDIGNTGNGIFVERATGNTIGGSIVGARNIISGNDRNGVELVFGSVGNTIQGNFIGIDSTGTTSLGNTSDGLVLGGAPNNVVGGTEPLAGNTISGNGGNGVIISFGATGNTFQGNFVGTDASGTVAVGNGSNGILLANTGQNLIGGSLFAGGNVLSGNSASGLLIFGPFSMANVVQGNRVGTDITGTADLGNAGQGIFVSNAPGNIIGGPAFPIGNIISGNGAAGVLLFGPVTSSNRVQGNLIGTSISGMTPLPNDSHGVFASGAASGNILGGEMPTEGNRVAFNGGSGVVVGFGSNENAIRSNAIFDNRGLGIDLGANGPTANDPGDNDIGANEFQNFPVLSSIDGNRVQGTVNGAPDSLLDIDFYASPALDPSGHGEGQIHLGAAAVQIGTDGTALLDVTLPAIPGGHYVTATATDARNNTSEFSLGLPVSLAAVGGSRAGDVNGDGRFDREDLVRLLQIGKFNTGQPAEWSEGDWNGDGVFDQLDLITALQAGRFEQVGFAAKLDAALADWVAAKA